MYCSPPGVLTAGLTVSVVAQLAAGANAGNWKLDLYDYLETSTWVNVGDLTGGECRVLHLYATEYLLLSCVEALSLRLHRVVSGCTAFARVAYVVMLSLDSLFTQHVLIPQNSCDRGWVAIVHLREYPKRGVSNLLYTDSESKV